MSSAHGNDEDRMGRHGETWEQLCEQPRGEEYMEKFQYYRDVALSRRVRSEQERRGRIDTSAQLSKKGTAGSH